VSTEKKYFIPDYEIQNIAFVFDKEIADMYDPLNT
jgi:hypothetical protein